MHTLKGIEEKEAIKWMERAGEIAREAKCQRAKCGSVIVSIEGIEIGTGYNAPPLDLEENRACHHGWSTLHKPNFDRTCCMHAEWRAILDAIRENPKRLLKSTLYFMRVNDSGELTRAGKPYCTVCSRFALDVGIKNFVLWHESGVTVYPTSEYNRLSYQNLDQGI